MHALNVLFIFVEFALDALPVDAEHVSLVTSWASAYGIFNGLVFFFTGDHVRSVPEERPNDP